MEILFLLGALILVPLVMLVVIRGGIDHTEAEQRRMVQRATEAMQRVADASRQMIAEINKMADAFNAFAVVFRAFGDTQKRGNLNG